MTWFTKVCRAIAGKQCVVSGGGENRVAVKVESFLAQGVPEPHAVPGAWADSGRSNGPSAYKVTGRVIACRILQRQGSDFIYLAIRAEKCPDNCLPIICLESNRFHTPLAQIGDKVSLSFRTNFRFSPLINDSDISGFYIDWAERANRCNRATAAAL